MTDSLEFGLDTFGDVTLGLDGKHLSHAQVIRNVIDEAVLADDAGVDFFGVGEHHRADFAVSAPEVVLAAIGGLTKQIRLGSAVTVLSTDDPVRVFQRFSTLNAATEGRAEVMLGRGWFTEAFSLFGYDHSSNESLFEEKLGIFANLARHGVLRPAGKLPAGTASRQVFPPLQAGSLKTWLAVGSTPDSVVRAARYNLPLMIAIIGGEPQRFRSFVDLYRSAFERLRRVAQPIGVHSHGYVADADDKAREEYWVAYKLMRDRLGAERGWSPIERAIFDREIDRGALFVGSPETVARKIAATVKALDVSRFNMKYSAGTLPHEKLMHSIELYGRKVIPLVREMLDQRTAV